MVYLFANECPSVRPVAQSRSRIQVIQASTFQRSSRNFHKRLLFLIDAKAALSAVAKGRSGAHEWAGTMCSIMALLLASDSLMRPLYIPSEENPADHPSRGRRRRPPARGVKRKETFSKQERKLNRAVRELRRLESFVRACSDFDTSSDGGSSLP